MDTKLIIGKFEMCYQNTMGKFLCAFFLLRNKHVLELRSYSKHQKVAVIQRYVWAMPGQKDYFLDLLGEDEAGFETNYTNLRDRDTWSICHKHRAHFTSPVRKLPEISLHQDVFDMFQVTHVSITRWAPTIVINGVR